MKNKIRVLIYGAGSLAQKYMMWPYFYGDYEIIGFIDSCESKWNTNYLGYRVYSPKDIEILKPDLILIWTSFYDEIINNSLKGISIPIKTYLDTEDEIINRLEEKYKSSDIEINTILKEYRKEGISVIGNYHPNTINYEVYYDNDSDPYILFEGKRMYYPKDFAFLKKDGKEYVWDVLFEQYNGSPHIYIRNEKDISDGSIIVDAGVCEGNFALRYIDRAKKVYLIEADDRWMKCLKKTFAPYKEKVVFCNKFLDIEDTDTAITIDSLVEEKIDFLKMDIEGYEVNALLGAKRVLRESSPLLAICSYHRTNDLENIVFLLESLGYKTENSSGYMLFMYDKNFKNTMDFRRGIVYGKKDNSNNF